jgi:hypothetical protein
MLDAARRVAPLLLVVALAVGAAGLLGAAVRGAAPHRGGLAYWWARAAPIDACTAITESGRYVLAEDLRSADAETCIDVRADDVTLSGAGREIDGVSFGQGTSGVRVAPGSENVTVRNLTVSRWAFGVHYEAVTGGEISNVTARFDADGVHVEESRNVAVRSVVAEHSFVGVGVSRSERVTVEDATARWNAIYGVSVAGSGDVEISDLVAERNEIGLGVFRSEAVTVRRATAASNRDAGIELTSAERVRIADATVRDNTEESAVRTATRFDAASATDVALSRTRDIRVRNLTTVGDWSVSLGPRTDNTTVSVRAEGVETLSLSGSGVVVSSAATPPLPANRSVLGETIGAETTASNATLSLAVRYADADLATADLAEPSLGFWRFEGRVWTPVASQSDRDESGTADGNLVRATITDFSTFAVLGQRATGTSSVGESGGGPDSSSGPISVTRKEGVEIEFTCESVRVSGPPGRSYSLVVHYYVPETDDYDRAPLGPLEGTVEEPFDDELVFFEVNVLVGGAVFVSGYIPEECPNKPGLALGASDRRRRQLLTPRPPSTVP